MSHNSPDFQLKVFGAPPRLANVEWQSLPGLAESDRQAVRDLVANVKAGKRLGLYLFSETSGAGKSALAVLTVKELVRAGLCQTFPVFELFPALMETLGEWRSEGKAMLTHPSAERLLRADIVVLDDVGVEKFSEPLARRFYLLLDRLWAENKAIVIFTSKYSVGRLANRAEPNVDEELVTSICSRILGLSTEIRVQSAEYDYRAGVVL